MECVKRLPLSKFCVSTTNKKVLISIIETNQLYSSFSMYNIADTSVTIIVISYHQNRDLGFHDIN